MNIIMKLMGSLLIAVISGLVMGVVLRRSIVTVFRLRDLTTAQNYEKGLSEDRRYAQKKFTRRHHIYWAPICEELGTRMAPIALWFIGKPFWAKAISLGIILGISALWAVSHTWERDFCRVRSFRPHWSSRKLRRMQLVSMLLQAGTYMGSFLIGAVLARQSVDKMESIVRIVAFLGIGWMSSTCTHSLHNYLLLAKNRWGQTYRHWRFVNDSNAN